MFPHKIWDNVTLVLIMLISLVLVFSLVNFMIGESPADRLSVMSQRALNLVFGITILLIIIVLVLENDNPVRTIAWILILLYLPVVGFSFYLLFGRNWRKSRIFSRKGLEDALSIDEYLSEEQIPMEPELADSLPIHIISLLRNNSKVIITYNNTVSIIPDTTDAFNRICYAIKYATRHIHLEYFSIANDETGNHLKELLISKAKQGVEIRFIYDDVGCWNLPARFKKEMHTAGIEFKPFMPVLMPYINSKLNYRNHRKMVIVDSSIAFLGGLNIADQYLGKSSYYGYWRDSLIVIEGDGVRSLQAIFLTDWYFVSQQNLLRENLIVGQNPKLGDINVSPTKAYVQIAASGPDTQHASIMQVYFTAIAKARTKIDITTPYLILNESLLMALKTAALSGVSVRILLPSKADHFIVFWGSKSYYEELLEAGVLIYEYMLGFIHAKVMIVDDQIVSIGTANMDMRSFNHNFEINALVYSREVARDASSQFDLDIANSKLIDLISYRKRSSLQRTKESICRLFSPVL